MYSARAIKDEDLELIMGWRMDPGITKWMNTDPALTLQDQKKWLERIQLDDLSQYWMICVDGQPAGVLSLFDIDKSSLSAEWGYYIGAAKLRSMNLAISIELSLYDYCFNNLGLKTVLNKVLADNEGVIKLHQICGNKITAVNKEAVIKNNIAHDQVCMEIGKADWESLSLPLYEKVEL